MEDLDVYIVYSVNKEKKGEALYPDDPRIIEAVVNGWAEAEKLVYYLRGRDSSRLYGCECWAIYVTADEYINQVEEWKNKDGEN